MTRSERRALDRLLQLKDKYPENDYGHLPASLGASRSAACRRLEKSGYVKINRIAANCFRYSITDRGIEALKDDK